MRFPPDLPDRPTTLVDVLHARARLHPDRSYLRFLESGDVHGPITTRTFGEVSQRALAIASRLCAAGLTGSPALLLYPPGADYIDAVFGCLVAGVIPVPAYPPDPTRLQRTLPRLRSVIADAGTHTALSTRPITALVGALGGPELAALNWITTDNIPNDAGDAFTPPTVGPQDVALLQYTSGSTGDPRGVVLTHASLLANEAVIFDEGGAEGPGVGWLPPYHDMGLIGLILQPFFAGYETVLMSPLAFLQRPIRWLQAISAFGGRQGAAPEFGFALMLARVRDQDLHGLDLSSWDQNWNGAEPIRAETIEAFEARMAPYGLRPGMIRPCYGLAESTLMATRLPRDARTFLDVDPSSLDAARLHPGSGRRLVSVGWPAENHALRVVNPDTNEPVADGIIGEIWLRGPSVASGYWRRAEETAQTFGAHLATGEGPWLRTGDLGAIGPDQHLFITGRRKDLIVIRGRNVFPQDIEATAAAAHARVRAGSVAAFEVEGPNGATVAVVSEIDQRNLPADQPELLNSALDAVVHAISQAHDLAVGAVVFVPYGRLLKTTSGKVRRQPTAEAWRAGDLPVVVERRAPGVDGPIYADLSGIAARADARKTAYQFDLDQDIAWDRADEPGVYVTDNMAASIAVDLHAARQAGATDTIQWTIAMAIARTFKALERSLLDFMQEERAYLGEHRSLTLLGEEEIKHIAMFERIEAALASQRPDLCDVFERHASAIEAAVAQNTDRSRFGSRAEYHYRFWINLLFFEDWTIWLQDVLRSGSDEVQPLWLSAHVAHAREEVQHTITDCVFLDALIATEEEQRQWARSSLIDIATPNVAAGKLVYAVCKELHPSFTPDEVSDDPRMLRLLQERGFRRLRAQVPLFNDIATDLDRPDAPPVQRLPDAAPLPDREALLAFVRERVSTLTGRDVHPADDDASFSQLGVDSAVRISLAGDLERHLGCPVSTTIAYDHPSIREVVLALEGAIELPRDASQAHVANDLASVRQARLVLLHNRHGGEAVRDHLIIGGELLGDIDEDALAVALSQLVQRHPATRTRFVVHDDGSVHTIVDPQATITLRHVEAEQAFPAAQRLARRLDARPYDLQRGPLLRAALVRDDDHAIVILAAHHSIGDSWSLDVLLRDWLTLYRARRDHTEHTLAPLNCTPRDLAIHEARLLASPEGERRRSYWRQQLGDHAVVEAEGPEIDFTGGSMSRLLDAERVAALNAWAEGHDESLFAVLLGATHLHLHRVEGLTDALVGAHHHRRGASDLAGLVDYRVDVLPLRTDLSELTGLHDAVQRTRATWIRALANSLPIDHLVTELAPEHVDGRSLLAPVAVNWIPFDYSPNDRDFCYDSRLVPPPGFLFFRRMLLAQPRGDGLLLTLWFNANTVSQVDVNALLDGMIDELPR